MCLCVCARADDQGTPKPCGLASFCSGILSPSAPFLLVAGDQLSPIVTPARQTLYFVATVATTLAGRSSFSAKYFQRLVQHDCFLQGVRLGSEDAPALVTIFFGSNDAALPDGSHQRQHVPLSEYKENLLKIVSHVKSHNKSTHVLLITPPPVCEETLQVANWNFSGAKPEDASARTNKTTGLYANACIEVGKKAEIPVVDLWSCMQEKSGWQTIYLSDGLHLSPEGNAVVFEKLVKVLGDEGLSFEAMPWDFPESGDVNADEPAKTCW